MNRRIEWIDVIKGIAILLVVIGHTFRDEMLDASYVCDFIKTTVYSFHLPLFFSISGCLIYLSREKNIQKITRPSFILKKLNTLIKPFITYGLLIYLIFIIANQFGPVSRILQNSGLVICDLLEYSIMSLKGENPYAIHLWFLLALFYMQVLAFVLNRISLKFNIEFKYLFLLVAIVLWNIRIIFVGSMTRVEMSFLRYTIYFCFGMIVPKLVIKKHSLYIILSGLAWIYNLAFLFYLTPKIDDLNFATYYALYFIQMLSIMAIIKNIYDVGKKLVHIKLLTFLGRNSFSIYLLHQPLCAFVGIILYGKLKFNIFASCMITGLVSILFPILFLMLIGRTKRISWICNKVFSIKII